MDFINSNSKLKTKNSILKRIDLKTKPLILVTNDDGIHAGGIATLIEAVKPIGDVIVVAPTEGRSGMSHAITVKIPIRVFSLNHTPGIIRYACTGTPVDSVKIAVNQLLDKKPDLLVSGINHGTNSSVSIMYSGTMAAVIEGCLNGIPSVGFSVDNHNPNADFFSTTKYIRKMVENILENGLQKHTCLNVNFPKDEPYKGFRVCRQANGNWVEDFVERTDPQNQNYYWLTGSFNNFEPNARDTDEWAISNGYISVVPVNMDFTDHNAINNLKTWNYEC